MRKALVLGLLVGSVILSNSQTDQRPDNKPNPGDSRREIISNNLDSLVVLF